MTDLKYDLKHTEDRMLEWKKAHWMQIGEDVNYSTDKLQAIWFLVPRGRTRETRHISIICAANSRNYRPIELKTPRHLKKYN